MTPRAFWLTVAATAIGGILTLMVYDWIKSAWVRRVTEPLNSTVRG